MTTSTVDRLVADYLGRLDAAIAALPTDRRDELLAEIGDHIATARAAGAAADEAAVRTLLDRLGPPEVIAAAALDDDPSNDQGAGRVGSPPSTALELTAVLMLTAGSFLPVVGWLVGLVLLWVSSRWTTAEKLLGTLVVPLGPGGALVLGGLPGQSCVVVSEGSSVTGETVVTEQTCTGFALPPWLGLPLLLAALVAPVVVAVVLYRRARARAALEPARDASSAWGGLELAVVLLLGLGPVVAVVVIRLLGLPAFAVPVVSVVVALALMRSSPAWQRHAKVIATALCASPLLLLVLLPTAPVNALLLVVLILAFGVGPIIASAYLAITLNRRR